MKKRKIILVLLVVISYVGYKIFIEKDGNKIKEGKDIVVEISKDEMKDEKTVVSKETALEDDKDSKLDEKLILIEEDELIEIDSAILEVSNNVSEEKSKLFLKISNNKNNVINELETMKNIFDNTENQFNMILDKIDDIDNRLEEKELEINNKYNDLMDEFNRLNDLKEYDYKNIYDRVLAIEGNINLDTLEEFRELLNDIKKQIDIEKGEYEEDLNNKPEEILEFISNNVEELKLMGCEKEEILELLNNSFEDFKNSYIERLIYSGDTDTDKYETLNQIKEINLLRISILEYNKILLQTTFSNFVLIDDVVLNDLSYEEKIKYLTEKNDTIKYIVDNLEEGLLKYRNYVLFKIDNKLIVKDYNEFLEPYDPIDAGFTNISDSAREKMMEDKDFGVKYRIQDLLKDNQCSSNTYKITKLDDLKVFHYYDLCS